MQQSTIRDRSPLIVVGVSAVLFIGTLALAADGGPAASGYTLSKIGKFVKGDAKAKQVLLQSPARELVGGEFLMAVVDLNDDGKGEAIVQGTGRFCGPDGCVTMVLTKEGSDWVKVAEHKVPPAEFLGITKETLGGYHLIANVDRSKQIVVANKRQLVYAIGGAAKESLATPVAAVVQQPEAGAKTSAPGGAIGPDVVGVRLGMSPGEAMDVIKTNATLRNPTLGRKELLFLARATNQDKPVPGGTFISGIKADSERNDEHLTVEFSPAPGKERALAITRSIYFGDGRQPPRADLAASLVKKYGEPSYVQYRGTASEAMYWSFKRDGTRLAVDKSAETEFNNQSMSAMLLVGGDNVVLAYGRQGTVRVQGRDTPIESADWERKLGAILIKAEGYGNGLLARQLVVKMVWVQALPEAAKEVAVRVRAANDADAAAEVNRASKNAPKL